MKLFILISIFLCQSLGASSDPIITQIIEERLDRSLSPSQNARLLSQQIDAIGKEALKRGMKLNGYNPKGNAFSAFPVWEGKSRNIPLTFFIFAWPAESVALSSNPSDRWYSSTIHSHPIPCALTVLRGSIIQENYEAVSGYPSKVARKVGERLLKKGDAEIDDLAGSVIHRLVCRDDREKSCLTLHAYGLPTEEGVWESFKEERKSCEYPDILIGNGTLLRER